MSQNQVPYTLSVTNILCGVVLGDLFSFIMHEVLIPPTELVIFSLLIKITKYLELNQTPWPESASELYRPSDPS
jgi:hypothetical protein